MAIVAVSREFYFSDPFFQYVLHSSFDTCTLWAYRTCDNGQKILLFDVTHEEIPDGDMQITPTFYQFPGVRPFIIDFGLPNN